MDFVDGVVHLSVWYFMSMAPYGDGHIHSADCVCLPNGGLFNLVLISD